MSTVETKASSRVKYIVIALFLLIPLLLLSLLFVPDRVAYASEIKIGNEIVSKVESFKHQHGRLPDTLEELGIKDGLDSSQVFYNKLSTGEYAVWFGTSLGECMSYDSQTKKWEGTCTPGLVTRV